MSNWIRKITKDRVLFIVILAVFAVLSVASIVSARSAQVAAEKGNVLIARSNINSPLIALIKDCTDPNGTCSKKNAANLQYAVSLVTAQQACVVEESLGYNLPARTPAEITEIKQICNKLLGGDSLDLLRRVSTLQPPGSSNPVATIPMTTTTQ